MRILLKNSENERRQKTRFWSCRADSATRCHHQFATVAPHRKVSLSAEPLALASSKPACCLKNCDGGKKSSFSTVSANKRGRNADFYVFTPKFTGSDATRYIDTGLIEKDENALDLGTAMAISAAAVSSNMGSATIKLGNEL